MINSETRRHTRQVRLQTWVVNFICTANTSVLAEDFLLDSFGHKLKKIA